MPVFKEELIHERIQYEQRGTATGLRLIGRSSLLITTIEAVVETPSKVMVEINEYSIYGEKIGQTQLSLHQIEKVVGLRILFNDPFYTRLRALRQNISQLRQTPDDRAVSLA